MTNKSIKLLEERIQQLKLKLAKYEKKRVSESLRFKVRKSIKANEDILRGLK